jgi:hypothetical protein
MRPQGHKRKAKGDTKMAIKKALAKFNSRCNACGSDIKAGDAIVYNPEVKYSSRHEKCPTTVVKSKVPLNSPGRRALQGRGRSDRFIGETSEIVLGFTSDSQGDQSDIGWTIRAKDGRYLTCIGVASHWVSQDEADDFDLVGPHGSFERHWSLLKHYRIATEEEAKACEARIVAKDNAKRFDDLCNYGSGYAWKQGKDIIADTDVADLGEQTLIWKKYIGYSTHRAWRVEAGLLTYVPVYDDSPYWQLIRFDAMTPQDAELVRNAEPLAESVNA